MSSSSNIYKTLHEMVESAEISILLINGQDDLMGIAQVLFVGVIEVNGFRISKSKFPDRQVYIQPPSYKSKKGYTKSFYLKDDELWQKLEKRIEEAYDSKRIDEAINEMEKGSI